MRFLYSIVKDSSADLGFNFKIVQNQPTIKGQLISKRPFGVAKTTQKKHQNFSKEFCPSLLKEVKSKK